MRAQSELANAELASADPAPCDARRPPPRRMRARAQCASLALSRPCSRPPHASAGDEDRLPPHASALGTSGSGMRAHAACPAAACERMRAYPTHQVISSSGSQPCTQFAFCVICSLWKTNSGHDSPLASVSRVRAANSAKHASAAVAGWPSLRAHTGRGSEACERNYGRALKLASATVGGR